MNRLVTPNGGMPLELDDLNFIQDAYKEGFKGVLHEFARQKNGNIILSGCEITGTSPNFSLSEGYVMIDYEIYYVPTQVSVFSIIFLEPNITYDANGNDVFFDGMIRSTYEVRKAKILISGTPPNIVNVIDANRLTTIIGDLIIDVDKIVKKDAIGVRYDFVVGDLAPNVSFSGAPPYAIKKNGRVVFYGIIQLDPSIWGAGNIPLITLPPQLTANFSSDGRAHTYLCLEDINITRIEIISPNILRYSSRIFSSTSVLGLLNLSNITYDIES